MKKLIVIALASFLATAPTASFAQGTTLVQMKADIDAMKADIKDLKAQNVSLKTRLDADEWKLTIHESVIEIVKARTKFLSTVGTDTYFSGTNLHIVNGSADSWSNGLGNLIVGKNAPRNNGQDFRIGSHNIIFGNGINYSGQNGLLGGQGNQIDSDYGIVLTGHDNYVGSNYTACITGDSNYLTGELNVVLTGSKNITEGSYGFIGTGWDNHVGNSTIAGGSRAYNFVISGRHNSATNNSYSGVISGSGNTSWGAGGVIGTGLGRSVMSNWIFDTN